MFNKSITECVINIWPQFYGHYVVVLEELSPSAFIYYLFFTFDTLNIMVKKRKYPCVPLCTDERTGKKRSGQNFYSFPHR